MDLENRVVGDLFDDRGADGNIRNSILEVHTYPPIPDGLETLQRFSSLAPTSSAKPRKRPLELPTQPYFSQNSRNIYRVRPSIEEGDAETSRPIGTASKRQRIQESEPNRTFDAHQPFGMREEQGGGPYHSSQMTGTQESIHQVLDSQNSPGKKRTSWLPHLFIASLIDHADPNPYGTPTSLPFAGPQQSIPSNEIDLSTIPDSPLGREASSASGAFGGAMQVDRESPKSESPELRTSVHEVPPTDPIDASSEQPTTSVNSPEPSKKTPFVFNPSSRPVSISRVVDEYAKSHGLGVRQAGEKEADVNRTPKRRPSTADLTHAQSARSNSKTLRESDPIVDPIESDPENSHGNQHMQSAKRLKSSETTTASITSPRTLNKAGAHRRDGQFLVPSVPQSHTNKARISLGEVNSPGQRENVQQSRRDLKDANMSVQDGMKRLGKQDAESPEQARSEPGHNEASNMSRKTPKSDTGYDELMSAAQNSSQATTIWSQDSNSPTEGATFPVVQQIDNIVSSQDKEPSRIADLVHDIDDMVRSPDDDRFAQEAERLAEEAEEQQEKKRIREKKAEEKRLVKEAIEEKNAANKEAAERKAHEQKLEDEKRAKDEKARAEESAQAKKAKAKENELAETKRLEETRMNAVRRAEAKKTSDKLAREQQTRETALAEEANKMMLAEDGAKQIEAEKKDKEKARRREMAAKNQANDAKAAERTREAQSKDREKKAREGQRAQKNAQELADNECKGGEQQTNQAGAAQETSTAMKDHGQKTLVGREVQKLRVSSEVRSRASTTPASSIVAGPNRSMTPVVPGCSVSKSSPQQSSLGSSPLSSRSSGNMDAPLRSALRQTPSGLSRSVSSVSFDVPPRSRPDEYIPSNPNSKSLKEDNNELAKKSSSATNLPKTSSRTISNPPAKTPMTPITAKKTPDSRITNNPAKNGKVQTKLKVTREVKKSKGRSTNPPITSTQAPKQEIIVSSGANSSTSEQEPVWQTGNAKAGPSSRKPMFPVTIPQKKTAEVKTPAAPIDPVISKIKVEKDSTTAPATVPRPDSKFETTSLAKSTSRSPALALSKTVSLSSGSASSSASESNSEVESDSEEPQAPSSKTPTDNKNSKVALVNLKGVSKAVNVRVKQSEGHLESKASSLSSQAPSSRSRDATSMHGDGKSVDQGADKQLQLESRQAVPSSRVNPASSTTNGPADGKVINQGLDHAGRLPNGIRPAYYKYPTLSELQKVPRAVTPMVKPKVDTSSSQPLGDMTGESSDSDSSSSDSDESSSDSDGDECVDGVSSQTSSKKKSSGYPGLKGLFKSRLSGP